MLRRSFILALILLPGAVFAQSPFAGKWQTRKNAITVDIAFTEGKVSGTVVFLDPHNDRREMAASNFHESGNALEFETKDEKEGTWYWRLTLASKTRGLLHGSVREMLIDEHVKKRS
jgi:hypothetical protein